MAQHQDETKALLCTQGEDGEYCEQQQIKAKYDELMDLLDNCDLQSEVKNLEKAMNYFCSQYDIGAGYRYAIECTLIDQYNNHSNDELAEGMQKVIDIINDNS